MTSTTPDETKRLEDMSIFLTPDFNDDFSEFFDFGMEDNAFCETPFDLSKSSLNPSSPIIFGNATSSPDVQSPVAGLDWPRECQHNLEPQTVTLSQLNLQDVDKSYNVQFEPSSGSQHGFVYPVPYQQPRDDALQQQQRILPVLAPRRKTAGDLQHPPNDKTPERAKSGRMRTKTYAEEDIQCRYCNTKTKTPGELR